MTPVEVLRGGGPVILGMPHTGTRLPDCVADALNPRGRALSDTDWHVDELYRGLLPDVTTVRAVFHRYVVDPNRDPAGGSLYPGQNTTGLVPLTDFDGQAIWDSPPDQPEIARRVARFHAAYHDALAAEIRRVKAIHGVAILYDCHSIRATIPHLFRGVLPDLNIGTYDGVSAAPQVEAVVAGICASAGGYSSVVNGRFKGGWTTRHYGRPRHGVHAIQMELAQSTYLTEEAPPWIFDRDRAARLRAVLQDILETLADLAPRLRS